MPYGAQDGVWCGLRGDFAAEATVIADIWRLCHIGVASEFRVGVRTVCHQDSMPSGWDAIGSGWRQDEMSPG